MSPIRKELAGTEPTNVSSDVHVVLCSLRTVYTYSVCGFHHSCMFQQLVRCFYAPCCSVNMIWMSAANASGDGDTRHMSSTSHGLTVDLISVCWHHSQFSARWAQVATESIYYLRQAGSIIPGVCLSVCLLASSRKDYTERILLKILPKTCLWTRKKRVKFCTHSLLDYEHPKTENVNFVAICAVRSSK